MVVHGVSIALLGGGQAGIAPARRERWRRSSQIGSQRQRRSKSQNRLLDASAGWSLA